MKKNDKPEGVTPDKKKKAKKPQKMEPKLVASKQRHEIATIAKKFKIKAGIVRAAALAAGKNGKPSRSRIAIYEVLLKWANTASMNIPAAYADVAAE